jgi:hypothetical protein
MPDSPRGRLIRERVAQGLLPHVTEPTCWAGKTSIEVVCDGCLEPIAPDEVTMELVLDPLDRKYFFHGDCFRIWTVVQATS